MILARYGIKAEEIAKKAFEEYLTAKKKLDNAREQVKKYPTMHGIVTAEYEAKSVRAKADLLEAEQAIKGILHSHIGEIEQIGEELKETIEEYYLAEPAFIDRDILDLLNSGILTPVEYHHLIQNSINKGNLTMARIIAKHAGDLREEVLKKYGTDNEQSRALAVVSHMCDKCDGSEAKDGFEIILETYKKTADNPSMIEKWDSLTENAFSKLNVTI